MRTRGARFNKSWEVFLPPARKQWKKTPKICLLQKFWHQIRVIRKQSLSYVVHFCLKTIKLAEEFVFLIPIGGWRCQLVDMFHLRLLPLKANMRSTKNKTLLNEVRILGKFCLLWIHVMILLNKFFQLHSISNFSSTLFNSRDGCELTVA